MRMKRCQYIFSTEVTELEDIKSYTEHVFILLKILALKYFFQCIFSQSEWQPMFSVNWNQMGIWKGPDEMFVSDTTERGSTEHVLILLKILALKYFFQYILISVRVATHVQCELKSNGDLERTWWNVCVRHKGKR